MYRMGIDLGGTNIMAGIVDEENQLLFQASAPTGTGRETAEIVMDMANLVQSIREESGIDWNEISGIGVGSPGVIDHANGIVLYSNNFEWEDVPLAAMLRERLSKPVFIANDAQCAALGEAKAGAGAGCDNIILITLGTGVGSGIILNGKIFEGAHGGGGIAGHTVIVRHGEYCTCGRQGCLEAYASATALIREVKKSIQRCPDSILANMVDEHMTGVNGKTVFDALEKGDCEARRIIEEYIGCLGDGIVNLVDIFRPDKVFISGGICNQGENLTIPLNAYVRKNCFAGKRLFIPPVECAALGNTAGIIGASLLTEN